MDPRLAELYGTNEQDLEKLAAAELAEQLSEGGMDLDGLDEDDLEALAASVLEEDDEEGEEGSEKLAEADYLGRVMAHSFVQESREIEKYAAEEDPAAKKLSRTKRLKAHANKAWGKTKRMGKTYGSLMAGGRALPEKGGKPMKKGIMAALAGRKGYRGKIWGARGGTAAALGAAGYGAYKGMHKESSALDTLALERAEEILAESGAGDTSPYDVLGSVVEQRAAEILAANGYEME